MYVNKKYPAKVIKDSFFIDNILEFFAVEIEIPDVTKIVAVSLYRPNCHKHLSKAEQFEQFFTKFLEQLEYLL